MRDFELIKPLGEEVSQEYQELQEVVKVFDDACYFGSFGESLDGLSHEDLLNIQRWLCDYGEARLNLASFAGLRRKICGLLGKRPDFDVRFDQKVERLERELNEAINRLSDETDISAEYLSNFIDYVVQWKLESLESEITDFRLRSLIDIGERQVEPGESYSGFIVISKNESYLSNLRFLRKHLSTALQMQKRGV